MTHVSSNPLPKKVSKDISQKFTRALSKLNEQEAHIFYQHFFSRAERLMFAKRFAVLFLLKEGWSSYRIARVLKMSATGVRGIGRQFSTTNNAQILNAFGRTRQGSSLLQELGDLLVNGFSMDPKKRNKRLNDFESRYG